MKDFFFYHFSSKPAVLLYSLLTTFAAIAIAVVLLGSQLLLMPGNLRAQVYNPPVEVKRPTPFGHALTSEMSDFRLNFFSKETIEELEAVS